jgi:hypothetical protein
MQTIGGEDRCDDQANESILLLRIVYTMCYISTELDGMYLQRFLDQSEYPRSGFMQ